ncbi:ABC transporter permease [Microbacterium halotolerans]|uniref:ABC transporter permease n=1 Tax=Microbacterium halotolerans TaxID=246613 RepID=UPI000E6ABB0C|nr:ABC transporter permease [Microbacterium halotolerans]
MTAVANPLTAARGGILARSRLRITPDLVTLWIALAWLVVVLIAAVVPQAFSTADPTALDPAGAMRAPGVAGHPFGTDHFGRDIATLLAYGARTAMVIGISATVVGFVIGTLLGLVAGYAGGWVDMIVGRFIDMLMCFPGVLLAMIIAAGLGASMQNLIVAVGISAVPGFARIMRGQAMTVRSRLFIEAADSVGFGPWRILWRHLLPNALAPSIVMATVTVGVSIVAAASLSFLGLGARADVPDWGELLALGQPYLASAWWITTFPGIVLTLTVIAVSLAGDWLRDRFNVD